MKRTDYETLAMEEIVVEVENGFLNASVEVQNPDPLKNAKGGINAHSVNTDFTTDFTQGENTGWD